MSTSALVQPGLLNAVAGQLAANDPDLRSLSMQNARDAGPDMVDYLCAGPDDPHSPAEIFPRLRWGGTFVFVAQNPKVVAVVERQFAEAGFEITHGSQSVSRPMWGIPFLRRRHHYFAACRVHLTQVGDISDRFTHHVYLHRPAAGAALVVAKEVPSAQMVSDRLRARWPDLDPQIIEKRVRKFTEKIFPIFLTREVAILKILHRDLPEDYRHRVPKLLDVEQDSRGYVRRFTMTWLRNGGQPVAQLDFARQSADLLRMLHEKSHVMHLDLRLDNFVVTDHGVGFVDFGSAVRDDEDLKQNPLLNGLFEELMRTSEIQRMLGSMSRSGQVTSHAITCGLHRVDKAVDYFYLAVQISSPHTNPDLRGLIRYDPDSPEARELARLTEKILRPPEPTKPTFRSAYDILAGIEKIERTLGITPAPNPKPPKKTPRKTEPS
jgi:hypothetical protein